MIISHTKAEIFHRHFALLPVMTKWLVEDQNSVGVYILTCHNSTILLSIGKKVLTPEGVWGYNLQELVTFVYILHRLMRSTTSCPAVFATKFNAMKELYFNDLVHLLQNKKQYQLTLQQTHQISLIVKLLCTPQNKLQIPCSITLLQAMEVRVLLWLEQARD